MVRGGVRRAYLKAQLAIREVTALSPRTMAAIARNSLRMSRLESPQRRPRGGVSTSRDAGSFTGAALTSRGTVLAATFERATLHVEALADDVVRLAWGPSPPPYDVATRDASPGGPTSVVAGVEPAAAWLSTARLRVVVSDDGVVVHDADGTVGYEERTPLFDGPRLTLRRVLREGEVLRGLGEQARRLDLAGASYRLWNRDPGGSWGTGQDPLYCSIPVTVGVHGTRATWAFHENTHDARVVVGAVAHAAHGVEAAFDGGALVTYVALGTLDEVVSAGTRVLGAPAKPPRWALGYHHCRWGWRTDRAVADVLEGFASRGMPVSAVHLDIDHMDGFRVFTFDERRFGATERLVALAASRGARVVAIVDPAVRRDEGFEVYREGVEHGHFVTDDRGRVDHGTVWPGWAAFPDFTRAATRSWWGTKYRALTSRGIAGVWHDMNEPTSITLWGDRTLPRSDRFDLDGRGGDHAEAHAVYGLLMNRAGHEALAGDGTGPRPFVLSRSGWAGLARHAWHWTADVESSVEGLAQQVPTFLGLGLSLVPFTGSDVGGFSGIPSPQLYLRWMELGAVSPFFRTHCVLGAPDREPWRFPEEIEAAAARLLRLRYRLLPHLYRLADEAHRLGHPLWRPLDWPAPGAATGAPGCDTAFLLGNELLVAAVADPAARSTEVPLPPGRWRRLRLCDSLDGTDPGECDLEGGVTVTLDAPLGQPVVLQRAGTVVVLDDAWLDASTRLDASHATHRWSLHVVLDASGRASGRGYEDAGDGAGASRTDTYVATRDGRVTTLRWASEGGFAREGAVGVVLHGADAQTAVADGAALPVDRLAGAVEVRVPGRFEVLELRSGGRGAAGGPPA